MRNALIALMALTLAGCAERREPSAASDTAAPPAQTAAPAPITTADVGAAMPQYSAPLLDGSTFDVAKERGNVLFLNVWATWCGPCIYEIPELEKLHKAHAAEGFKVVGVSVDEGGEQGVRDFVAAQKMTYPVALDPQGKMAAIFDSYVLPTSVIVDRKGQIVWKRLGMVSMEDAEMMQAIQTALKS